MTFVSLNLGHSEQNFLEANILYIGPFSYIPVTTIEFSHLESQIIPSNCILDGKD